jgi:CheY-like chemotaxis protein
MAWVLVVDDHVDTAKVLARLLIKSGHMAECAHCGHTALARLRTGPPPDLMIVDFMMPGMDGLEVLRHVKASPETAGVKVVLYTAVNDDHFHDHCLQCGAADYWPKNATGYDVIARRVRELTTA